MEVPVWLSTGKASGASDQRKGGSGLNEPYVERFLEEDYPRLVVALTVAYGSRAAAEDAVLEAVARAWEQMDRGIYIESLPAWVATVARRLVKSGLRRRNAERRARARIQEPNSSSEDALERVENMSTLMPALHALPRREREAVLLHYYLDLPVAEVALAMRVSVGTVKTSLHRARKALAAKVVMDEEEEDEHAALG